MTDYNSKQDEDHVDFDNHRYEEPTHEMMLMSNLTKAPGPSIFSYATIPAMDTARG